MLSVTVSDLKRGEAYMRQWQDGHFSSNSDQEQRRLKYEQRSSQDNVFDEQSKDKAPVRSGSYNYSPNSQNSDHVNEGSLQWQRKRKRELPYHYTWLSPTKRFLSLK